MVFSDLTRRWIQSPDVPLRDRGEPDVALRVRHKAVCTRFRGLQWKFLKLLCRRIQPAEFVCCLSRVPKRSVRRHRRIVRARLRRRYIKFLNRHLLRGSNQNSCSERDGGENENCFFDSHEASPELLHWMYCCGPKFVRT